MYCSAKHYTIKWTDLYRPEGSGGSAHHRSGVADRCVGESGLQRGALCLGSGSPPHCWSGIICGDDSRQTDVMIVDRRDDGRQT